jgi:CAAX prenyl protease-like protein
MRARMKVLQDQLAASPVSARFLPFFIFVALTALQGRLGEGSEYWVYLGKTLVGAWLVWLMRPYVPEMRWAFSWEAVVVGVGVGVLWVGLDPYYPRLNELLVQLGLSAPPDPAEAPKPWNPFAHFGAGSLPGWLFVLVRIAGSSLVVPPLEEVFYRSFLYRYLIKADFAAVPLSTWAATPFGVTAVVFGLVHYEWLAGILCGAAYLGLVVYKGRLGDAMTAHAITNFLLGVWVVWKGAWQFW